MLNDVAKVGSRKEYLLTQVHQLRQWALIIGSVFILVTIVMDYFRFPHELSKVTLPLRFIFLFVPGVWLTVIYWYKAENDHRAYHGILFYIVIALAIIHAYIYYAANMQEIFFPKTGITVILIYAGLLFALPLKLSILASLIIVFLAGASYYFVGEGVSVILVHVVFYLMISICCILINFICLTILTKNYRLIKLVQNQAYTDVLTGLYNRRFFYSDALKRIKQVTRDKINYALIAIDLDFFKLLNDGFGHKFGDEALVKVSAILSSHCRRPFDFAARMGGDEFFIFFYGADEKHIELVCQKILSELDGLKIKLRKTAPAQYLSASIGAVIVKPNSQNFLPLDNIVQIADQLLYEVKKAEKNNFIIKIVDSE